MLARGLAFAPLALLLAGCATLASLGPNTSGRLQEAVNDLNTASRFSQMDLVTAHVALSERIHFLERHKDWNSKLRIIEVEVAGLNLHEEKDADVFVSVSWQPVADIEMHTTTVHQKWHDQKGTFLLVSEERSQGDYGLFGEAIPASKDDPSKAPHDDLQFRTTVIR